MHSNLNVLKWKIVFKSMCDVKNLKTEMQNHIIIFKYKNQINNFAAGIKNIKLVDVSFWPKTIFFLVLIVKKEIFFRITLSFKLSKRIASYLQCLLLLFYVDSER